MKPYADYAFYAEIYGGDEIPEEKYEIAALNASQYIKYITLGRSERYSGNELKYATCAAAEAYAKAYDLTSGNNAAGQIKIENTDGYSVSYVTQTKDGESQEELFKRKAYSVIQYWLQGTNLLNRKVGCGHADQFGLHHL